MRDAHRNIGRWMKMKKSVIIIIFESIVLIIANRQSVKYIFTTVYFW